MEAREVVVQVIMPLLREMVLQPSERVELDGERARAESAREECTRLRADLEEAEAGNDRREEQLRSAIEGLLSEWDKLTRYGSPMAKTANERVAAARKLLEGK
jgi:hypothetical protein